MIRLFVALRPPRAIRDRLADVMEGMPGARWQADEQLHLTLRFIGEVERPQAEDVAAALGRIHAEPPVVALDGVGRFGAKGRTDALWAGIAPAAALQRLAASVDQCCVQAGLEPERRAYLPHVTVARLSRSAGAAPEVMEWLVRHAALSSEPFVLPHLILYRSHLGRAGASYEPVARWPLGTAAADAGSQGE